MIFYSRRVLHQGPDYQGEGLGLQMQTGRNERRVALA